MKIREFEFNLRELAGSMGDFGTLLPLAIGYIVVVGLNPAGFLVMLGLTNITLGLVYKLPMPLQPKKVIAVAAISQKWSPGLVYGSGLGLGIVWLILAFTNFIEKIAQYTPKCIVRGILLALGISLALAGFGMMKSGIILGVVSIVLILWLRNNRRAPAAIILVLLGLIIMAVQGKLFGMIDFNFNLPPFTIPSFKNIYEGMLLAGIAQIPLTITNAVIMVTALIQEYFPQRPVSEKKILLNMGIMNVIVPFFGGFPMCHGGGGLVSQYTFGARTGGANIMEGLIEVGLGLFFASSIVNLFSAFPASIVGAMLIFVSFQLVKFIKDIKLKREIVVMVITALLSVVTNMAIGFAAGMLIYYLFKKIKLIS